ncbi:MAG: hypothetical protein ACYTEE_10860 [Planctomycetota bacterium]|jgi:hypothetical protein
MKLIQKIAVFTLFVCMVVGIISPAFAGNGNNMPSGPHYELGLIGRPNTYTGSGTDNSNRHNIFIPLDTDGYVDGKVKLKMTQGDGFLVVDGDATEDGVARLQIDQGYYAVFARALGKPGGNINFTAWFTYWLDAGEAQLSDAIWLGNVDLTRDRRKPQTVEISKLFYYTGCLFYDPDGIPSSGDEQVICYQNDWVFDILGFNEYWWDIDNNGLKRLEIRFYPVPAGYVPPPLP